MLLRRIFSVAARYSYFAELACFYVAFSRLRLDTEAVLTSSVLAGLSLAAVPQERLHLIEIEGYPHPADFEGCRRAVLASVTEGLSVMAVDSGHVCRKGPGPRVAFLLFFRVALHLAEGSFLTGGVGVVLRAPPAESLRVQNDRIVQR